MEHIVIEIRTREDVERLKRVLAEFRYLKSIYLYRTLRRKIHYCLGGVSWLNVAYAAIQAMIVTKRPHLILYALYYVLKHVTEVIKCLIKYGRVRQVLYGYQPWDKDIEIRVYKPWEIWLTDGWIDMATEAEAEKIYARPEVDMIEDTYPNVIFIDISKKENN